MQFTETKEIDIQNLSPQIFPRQGVYFGQYKSIKQEDDWVEQGLCHHCGGKMSGLFTKKCKSCDKDPIF